MAAGRRSSHLKHSPQLGRGLDGAGGRDDGVQLRRQHGDVVGEVPHEGDDVHALREPLDLAEEQHEAIFLGQLVQGPPLALVLPHDLDLRLGGQEAHQALHKVDGQGLQVEPGGTPRRHGQLLTGLHWTSGRNKTRSHAEAEIKPLQDFL